MQFYPLDRRLRLWPALIATLMLASGCTPQAARWSPAEAPKTNTVHFVTMRHEVRFVPGAAIVREGQARRLARFLADVGIKYGDQVTIDAGPFGASAARNAVMKERLDFVAGMLRRLHVIAKPALRPTVAGALAADGVIVTVGRYVVTTPRCPDRSKPEADDFTNTPPSNFGCATVTDLGLMVANPADLVRGEPAGGADGDFLARGVELYQSGAIGKSLESGLSQGSDGGAAQGSGAGGGN